MCMVEPTPCHISLVILVMVLDTHLYFCELTLPIGLVYYEYVFPGSVIYHQVFFLDLDIDRMFAMHDLLY